MYCSGTIFLSVIFAWAFPTQYDRYVKAYAPYVKAGHP